MMSVHNGLVCIKGFNFCTVHGASFIYASSPVQCTSKIVKNHAILHDALHSIAIVAAALLSIE